MIMINLHQAKTHLSQYVNQEEHGEVIVICKRNVPVAEIKQISKPSSKEIRPIGLAEGSFSISPDFFAPLPDDLCVCCHSLVALI